MHASVNVVLGFIVHQIRASNRSTSDYLASITVTGDSGRDADNRIRRYGDNSAAVSSSRRDLHPPS